MEYTEHYDNMEERNSLCSIAASNGFRNIHDTFDSDWQRGDEPHGTLIFTDVMPEPEPEPEPAKIELLEVRIKALEDAQQ